MRRRWSSSRLARFEPPGTSPVSRVLHVGEKVEHLSVRHNQLVAEARHETTTRTAPLSDVDVVVLSSHLGLSLDLHTLRSAVDAGTAVVVCDERHLPNGVLLPLFGSWNHTEVLHQQLDATAPRRKRAWQQIVRRKIEAQARALPKGSPVASRLDELATQVRSGDPENVESQAARIYWPAMLGVGFRRRPQTREGVNGALDYGYAIVRSVVARCAVAVGLHPALGVHHSSRTNPLCLADDLMEPLRPVVDRLVAGHRLELTGDLDPDGKLVLTTLLELPFRCGKHKGTLTTATSRYGESFREYITGRSDTIMFPEALDHSRDQ